MTESDNWQDVVEEMKQVLAEVERGHRELQDALLNSRAELRLALTIALIVVQDKRRAKSVAKHMDGTSADDLIRRLKPLLEAVLD